MKYLIFILVFFIGSCVSEVKIPLKRIKIAVVDTGLITKGNIPLCEPEIDYTTKKEYSFGNDELPHGTNVSHIINDIVKDTDQYCQIIIKVSDNTTTSKEFFQNSIKAWKYLLSKDVDVINYSAGGESESAEEKYYILKLLDKKVIFVTAAGNAEKEKPPKDLDKLCNFYPACYDDRIIVVGNIDVDGNITKSSNYGTKKVKIFAEGNNIKAGGFTLSGTSQSAAVVSGNIIKNAIKHRHIQSTDENNMYKSSATAFYKQSGTDKMLENYYKKKTSKEVQYFLEKTLPISQMLYNKKIQYEWTFE